MAIHLRNQFNQDVQLVSSWNTFGVLYYGSNAVSVPLVFLLSTHLVSISICMVFQWVKSPHYQLTLVSWCLPSKTRWSSSQVRIGQRKHLLYKLETRFFHDHMSTTQASQPPMSSMGGVPRCSNHPFHFKYFICAQRRASNIFPGEVPIFWLSTLLLNDLNSLYGSGALMFLYWSLK